MPSLLALAALAAAARACAAHSRRTGSPAAVAGFWLCALAAVVIGARLALEMAPVVAASPGMLACLGVACLGVVVTMARR